MTASHHSSISASEAPYCVATRLGERRYLAVMAAVAMTALLASGLANFVVDPGEQFARPASRAAVAVLGSGRAISYDKNLDLRLINRRPQTMKSGRRRCSSCGS